MGCQNTTGITHVPIKENTGMCTAKKHYKLEGERDEDSKEALRDLISRIGPPRFNFDELEKDPEVLIACRKWLSQSL